MGESLHALGKAIERTGMMFDNMMKSTERMAALGFPFPDIMLGSLIEAPFDYMSDTLRGMRGIMLDMLKRPDKLLEAEKKVLKFQVEFAIQFTQQTGMPFAQIPLHRGSDGFMSLKQFEKFYWPTLKDMILQLIDNGITPIVFWEGVWDQRLDYLQELPKGKTWGMFQSSDIFKVKEKLGDVMLIVGGMPNSLLHGGSVEQIRERTKKVCEVVGRDGGFMMCTEVGDLEGSKPELVKAWVDATKEFGQY
jgi:uroporphyrinogen-III decarboxylase